MPILSKLILASLIFVVLCLGSATTARADTVAFTGTRTNQGPPAAPGGRCSPAFTVNINPSTGNSTGTSNFGNFTSIQSHCITPPLPAPFDNGLFTWTFASGDTLAGTYFGALTASGAPGVFNDTENYTITGGTGLFAGATGNIIGSGTVTFAPGSLPISNVILNGTVTGPGLTAVPEPTTMLLLGTGLAGVSATVRKRRKANNGT